MKKLFRALCLVLLALGIVGVVAVIAIGLFANVWDKRRRYLWSVGISSG